MKQNQTIKQTDGTTVSTDATVTNIKVIKSTIYGRCEINGTAYMVYQYMNDNSWLTSLVKCSF